MARSKYKLLSFILLLVLSQCAVAQNNINSVRIWPSPESTRVVFDLTEKPDFS
ncbi:MAG: N-acetylmuramoyl-L-alanine amidase, partial [Pseudoalteromonas sp.]